MTRTTGRTLALLALLQARREWTGAELRARLEVSDRTLRRDVDDLRELGYGIEATRGRHGGYRLGPGASVPPLTLSDDESVAIAVGLRVAATTVVTGMEDAAARALAKLEQSLSQAARARIVEVEQALVPFGAPRDGVELAVVTAIASAISAARRVRVDYTRHDGEEVTREIEPHRIVHTVARWYLVARDPRRDAWRTFRIDRVRRVVPLRETFTPRSIPDDALRRLTAHSITTAPYPCSARVLMHAPAAEVARRFDTTSVTISDDGDGTCTLEAGARSPEELATYLGASGIDFEIVSGDEVRVAVASVAARLGRALGGACDVASE